VLTPQGEPVLSSPEILDGDGVPARCEISGGTNDTSNTLTLHVGTPLAEAEIRMILAARIILLADGKAARWSSPTPKHLVTVDGEILLHRTVRQLRDRGATVIWITSHDPAYDIPGTTRYEPADNMFQIDQFYACRELWRHLTNVVFFYADVYFSDEALDLILNHVATDYAYYQRTFGSRITGKPWKEGFALRVWDPEILLSACCYLRGELVAGRLEEQHHQLQGYLEGCGEGEYFETAIGPHGVEIDDETDDFDVPSDVQTWTNRVATWRHTRTRLRGETIVRPTRPKIKFADFWAGFKPEDNALHAVLEEHFQAVLCDEPDYLFFSVFGGLRASVFDPRYDKCVKILWTGENVRPNFNFCDYALSFDYFDDPRNLRWPQYAHNNGSLLRSDRIKFRNTDVDGQLARKTRFCNFLYSNAGCQTRNDFFKLLSEYKEVDSGGSVLNNLGRRVDDKLEFLSHYKFTIAFENASSEGYVTEKIADPLSVYSVPIYWGNPRVAEDFNPGCFINAHDYGSLRELVERVAAVDRDDDLYLQHLRAPCFPGNVLPRSCRPEYLVDFLEMVFSDRQPRNHRRPTLSEQIYSGRGWAGALW